MILCLRILTKRNKRYSGTHGVVLSIPSYLTASDSQHIDSELVGVGSFRKVNTDLLQRSPLPIATLVLILRCNVLGDS